MSVKCCNALFKDNHENFPKVAKCNVVLVGWLLVCLLFLFLFV